MKRSTILATVAILFISVILVVVNYNLFEDAKPIEIIQFDSGNSKYRIAISYVRSNTTIQEQIIIQKSYENGSRKLLSAFERYQVLNSYQIDGDTLIVVLSDTSSYMQRMDTLKITIAETSNSSL